MTYLTFSSIDVDLLNSATNIINIYNVTTLKYMCGETYSKTSLWVYEFISWITFFYCQVFVSIYSMLKMVFPSIHNLEHLMKLILCVFYFLWQRTVSSLCTAHTNAMVLVIIFLFYSNAQTHSTILNFSFVFVNIIHGWVHWELNL